MAALALSFTLAAVRLAAHVLVRPGHFAHNRVWFGRIHELRCVCGEIFWRRP